MGKKKTKKISKEKIDITNQATETKTSIPRLLLSIGKCLGTMLLIYLIAFLIFTIINYFSVKNHGYDSSNEVINKYMTSMLDNKPSKMNKCLNYDATNSYDMRNLHKSYTDLLDQMNVTFDKNIVEIKDTKYENINELEKSFNKNITIDEAYLNLVYISFIETINGDKFDGIIEYEIITYKTNDKWYVFDMKQKEIATALADGNEFMTVGDNTLGYIALNKEWTPVDTNILDGTVSSIAYISPNNNAMISLNIIQSEKSYSDYIDEFTTSLTNNKIEYVTENRTINDISMKYIYYTTIDENNTKIHQCTWFFEQPMKDGYIHCITFDCNDSGQYATNYIEMFHY